MVQADLSTHGISVRAVPHDTHAQVVRGAAVVQNRGEPRAEALLHAPRLVKGEDEKGRQMELGLNGFDATREPSGELLQREGISAAVVVRSVWRMQHREPVSAQLPPLCNTRLAAWHLSLLVGVRRHRYRRLGRKNGHAESKLLAERVP